LQHIDQLVMLYDGRGREQMPLQAINGGRIDIAH